MNLPNCPLCRETPARVLVEGVIICGGCFSKPDVSQKIKELKERHGRTINS